MDRHCAVRRSADLARDPPDQYGVQVQIIEVAARGWRPGWSGQTFAAESFPMKRK